jgi:hypothetical protein
MAVTAEALALGDDLDPGADEHQKTFDIVVVAGDLQKLRENQPRRRHKKRPD